MKRIGYHPHVHPAQPWCVFDTNLPEPVDVSRLPKIALFATRQQAREYAARRFVPEPMTAPRPPTPRPPRTTEALYKLGDRVRHPSFGAGIVVGVRANGDSDIVDVNFAGPAGVKKLDTAFASLTRE